MDISLGGKVALVTGASKGIGLAMAQAFAAHGAQVMLSSRKLDALEEAAATIDGETAVFEANAGDPDAAEAAIEATVDRFGGVDILVNNAAEVITPTIADTTEAAWDRAFAVNAKAPFFLIQQAARRMRDDGRVINISTITTALAEPGASLYAGSKAALEQVTRSAAWELAPRRITVNAISPGATDTDLLHAVNPPEALAQAVAMTPLGRLGLPADIADLIAFLASPDARWLTGQNIRATGGLA